MTRTFTWRSRLAAAALLAGVTTAHAETLDFGNGPAAPSICTGDSLGLSPAGACTDGLYLSQAYGDVSGLVNISYFSPRPGDGTSLRWWGPDYNNLYGVLYAGVGSDSDSLARIVIEAVAPDAIVTLRSFDLGAFNQTTRDTHVTVYGPGNEVLFSFDGSVGNGALSATSFNVNISAVGGLWLDWGDSAYNVGIDNVQFSVSSAVPEPGAASMMLAGILIGLLALRGRRAGP